MTLVEEHTMQINPNTILSARFSFTQNENNISSSEEILRKENAVIESDIRDFPSLKNIASFRSFSRMLEVHQSIETLQKQNIILLLNLLADAGIDIKAGTVQGSNSMEKAPQKVKAKISNGGHSRFRKSDADELDDEEDDDEGGELDDPLRG